MTDDKKAREQALQAAAMELKAKGEQTPPEGTTPPQTPVSEPAEQKPSVTTEPPKPASKKSAADALKELARVRRNKIIGITAAVIAVMVGIFLIARGDLGGNKDHGGAPTVMEDGTKVYPDGTQELSDGTVIDADGTTVQPDGTIISADGTVTKPDGTVVPPTPVSPGDSDVSNVNTDTGTAAPETPWSTLTDGDYQIAIRRLNPYSGPFVEDGTDEMVTNVLALQFRNDSQQAVQYAEYVFDINGEEVAFKLSNLDVGQRCVVLAANRHAYNANEVLKLKSRLVAAVDVLPSADNQILPVVVDDTITVMNTSDQNIPVARVFFKTYYAEEDTFFGGITYSITVENLPAGGSSEAVSPSHFSGEMSRFVGSGVYES